MSLAVQYKPSEVGLRLGTSLIAQVDWHMLTVLDRQTRMIGTVQPPPSILGSLTEAAELAKMLL